MTATAERRLGISLALTIVILIIEAAGGILDSTFGVSDYNSYALCEIKDYFWYVIE